MNTINTEDLRRYFIKLVAFFEELNQKEIVLKNDFFWDIKNEEIYNIEKIPNDLTLGSLIDDLECLKKLNDDTYFPTSREVFAISNILRYIGENLYNS